MNQRHSIAIERSGLPAGVLASLMAAGVLAFLLLRFATMEAVARPGGIIGYMEGGQRAWVRSDGQTAQAPKSTVALAPVIASTADGEFPSPDGAAVAFVEVFGEDTWLSIREGDVATRVGRLADRSSPSLVLGGKVGARSEGGAPLVVAWSPDGRRLAWGSLARPPYSLHLRERGAWEMRSLPLVGGYVGELAWSPDGRYLGIGTYAANRSDHTILMLDTMTDLPPRQLAHGCIMVWSPDSRYLALHGEPTRQIGLWIVSVDGEAQRVIDREVAPFAWMPE